MHSVLMGFAIGMVGGPIGAAVGAGLGYLHGQSVKKEHEERMQQEVDRQKELEREVEQQIVAQRGGAGGAVPVPKSAAAPEQGVTIITDHLAPGRNPSGRAGGPGDPEGGVVVVTDHLTPPAAARVSGSPPASPPKPESPAAGRDPGVTGPRPDGVDGEGFKAVYEGGRVVRRERDVNGDGTPDIVVYYDDRGQLLRREESSWLNGRIDTRTFYDDGKVQRKESDTDGDGKPDLVAVHDREGNLARLESRDEGGRRVSQFYADGKVVREERPDLISYFNDAGQITKQARKGEDGRLAGWRYFDGAGTLLREEEIGSDGRASAVSYYEGGKLARRELYEVDDRLFTRAPVISEAEAVPGGGG